VVATADRLLCEGVACRVSRGRVEVANVNSTVFGVVPLVIVVAAVEGAGCC
jgi:hypothetical protein